ncbi:GNAT family N-acetyltransferase [Labrenzia sp. VG12]|uniref:GNAT family N-acetyltransferase n=1 Tax=Labrenzia sp. VG12 TaxID=2021862 RepID=UPI000B8BBBC7|nr:GNAT family N-acetyltransferase [Labrenzia sp. VG12]ASP36263.1 GNAT family N-acetyltransferase [Labrenzia sp. VG12]
MQYSIRVAEPADKAAVSDLLLKSYTALLKPAYDAVTLKEALPLITRANPELLSSGSYYVAVAPNGAITGAGGWTKHSPTGRDETTTNGNIRHFGTDPDEARKGIGRALMDRCIQEAIAAGLQELNCYSTLNGEAFYSACGFKTIEAFDVALSGGVTFPSLRMVRAL